MGGKRKRKEEIPPGTVVNEEIPQEKYYPGPLRPCNNTAEPSNDKGTNEEQDDGTTNKICKIPWKELTEKRGDWVQCNTCDKYICPKCYDKRGISADDDFFVSLCIRS